ncbi:MAG TPA: dihydroorotase, partial [Phnomibacter sp.]|nr:dihydroorotase [Phnomibacter sp.]
HVTGISTAASVQLIRQAKQEGLQITASVAPYHLHFTHEALSSYNTNLKVTPPLRTPEDVAAIKQALAEGTVDCIASHHLPHEWDSKTCEFEYARYGMAGLETCLGALGAALPSLSPEQVVERMALAPAAIFGLPLPKLVVDESALLTLWQYGATWTAQADHLRGKSTNNAFIGQPLLHKPLGIVASNQYFVA